MTKWKRVTEMRLRGKKYFEAIKIKDQDKRRTHRNEEISILQMYFTASYN